MWTLAGHSAVLAALGDFPGICMLVDSVLGTIEEIAPFSCSNSSRVRTLPQRAGQEEKLMTKTKGCSCWMEGQIGWTSFLFKADQERVRPDKALGQESSQRESCWSYIWYWVCVMSEHSSCPLTMRIRVGAFSSFCSQAFANHPMGSGDPQWCQTHFLEGGRAQVW